MPQIRSFLALTALCLAGALALSGCGDENSKATFSSTTGKHPAGWLPQGHREAARSDLQPCFDCHGERLEGGISKVACSSCHPVEPFSVHPLQFGEFAFARHAGFLRSIGGDTASCALAACHGTTLNGAGRAPDCATACHLGGVAQAHPALWTVANPQGGALPGARLHGLFVTAGGGYDASRCANFACHGGNLRGGTLIGPSCYGCHPADPQAANPRPQTHPSNLSAGWMNEDGPGFHGDYVERIGSSASCVTSFCHGGGNTEAPSCSTRSYTNRAGITSGCH